MTKESLGIAKACSECNRLRSPEDMIAGLCPPCWKAKQAGRDPEWEKKAADWQIKHHMTIEHIQREAYVTGLEKGWFKHSDDRYFLGHFLMRVATELGEAYECWRYNEDLGDIRYKTLQDGQRKPDGFPTELADCVILLCELAEFLHINLAEAIRIKMDFNRTRPYLHGGKKA